MERVKNMSKFMVLSELKKMVSKQPMKVTDVNINRDIFEIPEEKINKTSLLYSVKDGNKNLYIPILEKEEQQQNTVSDELVDKLMKSKRGDVKKLISEYIKQEREVPSVSYYGAVKKHEFEKERKEKERKEKTEQEMREKTEKRKTTEIVPYEKKEIEKTEQTETNDIKKMYDVENMSMEQSKELNKLTRQRMRKLNLIPVIQETIKEAEKQDPTLTKEEKIVIEANILNSLPEVEDLKEMDNEEIKEDVKAIAEEVIKKVKLSSKEVTKLASERRLLYSRVEKEIEKNKKNPEELMKLADTQDFKTYEAYVTKKGGNKKKLVELVKNAKIEESESEEEKVEKVEKKKKTAKKKNNYDLT